MSNFKNLIRSSFLGFSFFPSNIPEIANGYWWRAGGSSGIGTTAFRIIEQNGHSSFDLVQSTVARQPILLSEAGGIQLRMKNTFDINPSILGTLAPVQVGWQGPTYVGGWFRLPAGWTGNFSLFQHTLGAGNQGRITINGGGVPSLAALCSTDGMPANIKSNIFLVPQLNDLAWHWCELLFTGVGATDADKAQMYIDFTILTRTGGISPMVTQLFNANAPIGIACRFQNSLANVDTTDWATAYYGNGIPSLENRKLLANFYNPSGVLVV